MTNVRLTHIRINCLDLGFPVYDQFKMATFTPQIIICSDVYLGIIIAAGITRRETIHDLAYKIKLCLRSDFSITRNPSISANSLTFHWFSYCGITATPIKNLKRKPIPSIEDLDLSESLQRLPLYYLRLLLDRNLKPIHLERFALSILRQHNKKMSVSDIPTLGSVRNPDPITAS